MARRARLRRVLLAALLPALVNGGCSVLDEQQRKWIFQPSDRTWWGGQAAAEGMQDLWIGFRSEATARATRLHGLWLPQARAATPVLLYLHMSMNNKPWSTSLG